MILCVNCGNDVDDNLVSTMPPPANSEDRWCMMCATQEETRSIAEDDFDGTRRTRPARHAIDHTLWEKHSYDQQPRLTSKKRGIKPAPLVHPNAKVATATFPMQNIQQAVKSPGGNSNQAFQNIIQNLNQHMGHHSQPVGGGGNGTSTAMDPDEIRNSLITIGRILNLQFGDEPSGGDAPDAINEARESLQNLVDGLLNGEELDYSV